MENVTIRGIDLAGYIVPIFIRIARRHEATDPRGSYLRNVLIENVRGSCATSRNGCSITGLPDLRPSTITLRNVSLVFPGGGTDAERDLRVPELERGYPEGVMFGRNLPAWAFYLRHADDISFENVTFTLSGNDAREMIVNEDCTKWYNGARQTLPVEKFQADVLMLHEPRPRLRGPGTAANERERQGK